MSDDKNRLDGKPKVRIVTWNIDSSKVDRRGRFEGIVETLKEVDADVICLQEVLYGGVKHFAKALDMQVVIPQRVTDVATFGNVILTRLPLSDPSMARNIHLEGVNEKGYVATLASAVLKSQSGRDWNIMTSHLAWGGLGEGIRLRQAYQIEAYASSLSFADRTMSHVFMGDLNTLPESETIRFFKGLVPDDRGLGCMWLDAWEIAGEGPGYTSGPFNPLSAAVARSQGILDPSLLPSRRIDFMFVRGFAYGRPGYPLNVRLIGNQMMPEGKITPSDHYGIVADLWDPSIATT